MTGKSVRGEGREVYSSPAVDALYDDSIKLDQAANARIPWDEIADAGIKVVNAVAKRGQARGYHFSEGFNDFSSGPKTEGYGDIEFISKYIDSRTRPANQSWLKWVTGKVHDYVFGASVDKGHENEGIYADEGLLKNAGRYVRTKADKYLSSFIQTLITVGRSAGNDKTSHEGAHYDNAVTDEEVAERYGVENVLEFTRKDPFVDEAVNRYRDSYFDLAA